MKKIKLMLMTVLVVGAVGGAFAFKATKGQQLFCGTSGAANDCPIPTTAYKIATGNPVAGVKCSTVINFNCRTVLLDQ